MTSDILFCFLTPLIFSMMKEEINKLVRLNMYIPHQSWCANEFRTVSLYLVCCIHSLTIYVPSKRCKCGNLWVVQCMSVFLCSGRSQCSLSMSTLWTLSNTIFTVPQLVTWFIHTIAMAKDCKNWSLVSHSHRTMRRTSLHACSVLGSFMSTGVWWVAIAEGLFVSVCKYFFLLRH